MYFYIVFSRVYIHNKKTIATQRYFFIYYLKDWYDVFVSEPPLRRKNISPSGKSEKSEFVINISLYLDVLRSDKSSNYVIYL